ncbi:hypothetical protein Q4494_18455, partial [Celeribacter halophilus]
MQHSNRSSPSCKSPLIEEACFDRSVGRRRVIPKNRLTIFIQVPFIWQQTQNFRPTCRPYPRKGSGCFEGSLPPEILNLFAPAANILFPPILLKNTMLLVQKMVPQTQRKRL